MQKAGVYTLSFIGALLGANLRGLKHIHDDRCKEAFSWVLATCLGCGIIVACIDLMHGYTIFKQYRAVFSMHAVLGVYLLRGIRGQHH
jgi:hypothetical protein